METWDTCGYQLESTVSKREILGELGGSARSHTIAYKASTLVLLPQPTSAKCETKSHSNLQLSSAVPSTQGVGVYCGF